MGALQLTVYEYSIAGRTAKRKRGAEWLVFDIGLH